MKQFINYLMIPAIFVFMLIGCAQWGGDNPLGITGGSKQGYGENNDFSLPETSGEIDPNLVGKWSSYGDIFIIVFDFYADGTFTREEYYDRESNGSAEGTWSVSGDILTLRSSGDTQVYTYFINDNQLTLFYGDYVLVFYRGRVIG
jgi:hypothetical protein